MDEAGASANRRNRMRDLLRMIKIKRGINSGRTLQKLLRNKKPSTFITKAGNGKLSGDEIELLAQLLDVGGSVVYDHVFHHDDDGGALGATLNQEPRPMPSQGSPTGANSVGAAPEKSSQDSTPIPIVSTKAPVDPWQPLRPEINELNQEAIEANSRGDGKALERIGERICSLAIVFFERKLGLMRLGHGRWWLGAYYKALLVFRYALFECPREVFDEEIVADIGELTALIGDPFQAWALADANIVTVKRTLKTRRDQRTQNYAKRVLAGSLILRSEAAFTWAQRWRDDDIRLFRTWTRKALRDCQNSLELYSQLTDKRREDRFVVEDYAAQIERCKGSLIGLRVALGEYDAEKAIDEIWQGLERFLIEEPTLSAPAVEARLPLCAAGIRVLLYHRGSLLDGARFEMLKHVLDVSKRIEVRLNERVTWLVHKLAYEALMCMDRNKVGQPWNYGADQSALDRHGGIVIENPSLGVEGTKILKRLQIK